MFHPELFQKTLFRLNSRAKKSLLHSHTAHYTTLQCSPPHYHVRNRLSAKSNARRWTLLGKVDFWVGMVLDHWAEDICPSRWGFSTLTKCVTAYQLTQLIQWIHGWVVIFAQGRFTACGECGVVLEARYIPGIPFSKGWPKLPPSTMCCIEQHSISCSGMVLSLKARRFWFAKGGERASWAVWSKNGCTNVKIFYSTLLHHIHISTLEFENPTVSQILSKLSRLLTLVISVLLYPCFRHTNTGKRICALLEN